MQQGVADKQFERISKQSDLVVPPFYSLDNIIINKLAFNKEEREVYDTYWKSLDESEVNNELMTASEFNFYLEHTHSILSFVLNADFFEFHK